MRRGGTSPVGTAATRHHHPWTVAVFPTRRPGFCGALVVVPAARVSRFNRFGQWRSSCVRVGDKTHRRHRSYRRRHGVPGGSRGRRASGSAAVAEAQPRWSCGPTRPLQEVHIPTQSTIIGKRTGAASPLQSSSSPVPAWCGDRVPGRRPARYDPGIECIPADVQASAVKIYTSTYVVEFWKPGRGERQLWRSLDATDLAEVVQWARSSRHGETFVVYLEHAERTDVTLHRLHDGTCLQ